VPRNDAVRGVDASETEEGFRGAQVCSVVGITYRQLDYWARTAFSARRSPMPREAVVRGAIPTGTSSSSR